MKEAYQMTDEERTAEFLKGLKAFIKFVEKNNIVLDYPQVNIDNWVNSYVENSKDVFKAKVKALGTCKKTFADTYISAKKHFGQFVSIEYSISREQVCERIVKSVEEVPERVIPAYTKENIEWVCKDKIFTK